MDKNSVEYFMKKMTQEEFEERNKEKKIEFFSFNLIQPERSKRENSSNEEMRCSEHDSNIMREVQ